MLGSEDWHQWHQMPHCRSWAVKARWSMLLLPLVDDIRGKPCKSVPRLMLFIQFLHFQQQQGSLSFKLLAGYFPEFSKSNWPRILAAMPMSTACRQSGRIKVAGASSGQCPLGTEFCPCPMPFGRIGSCSIQHFCHVHVYACVHMAELAPDHADDEAPESTWPPLHPLAKMWDAHELVRAQLRRSGKILSWPSPASTGWLPKLA